MKIKSINAIDVLPVRHFAVSELSDVVVLAGANGVGKTRLLEWLIRFFRTLNPDPNNWLEIEATSATEKKEWGKGVLDTRNSQDCDLLRQTLHRNRKRSAQRSSILNFESNRSITQIKPYAFTWDVVDPYDEEVGWDSGFSFLRDRFTDTLHSIFRKIRSRRDSIAFAAEAAMREKVLEESSGSKSQNLIEFDVSKFPDPMVPFREAFAQLLGPKSLMEPDIKGQSLQFSDGAATFPITSLSSGEREVINIVFDFILRGPSDCVVVFDEPELHLHPELSYKLIQTLRTVGRRNQFLFSTHSADIISASIENSVIFISPSKEDGSNQAIVVREDDDTHQALKLLGQSVGIIALGRRIVLVEGEHGSLDKQTYGAILRNEFPNLVLVPSGGKDVIESFASLVDKVLNQSIWGVEFFMLCDGDTAVRLGGEASIDGAAKGRLRLLPRYHLENYFLDEAIIAEMFAPFEAEDSWLRSPDKIKERLREIAKSRLPYAAALIVCNRLRRAAGNIDLMPKGAADLSIDELISRLQTHATEELQRVGTAVHPDEIDRMVREVSKTLADSFENDSEQWKRLIPGRAVLRMFCAEAKFDFGRFKMAFIRAAEGASPSPFQEVREIFENFANVDSSPTDQPKVVVTE